MTGLAACGQAAGRVYTRKFLQEYYTETDHLPGRPRPENSLALDAPYPTQPQLRPFTARWHKPGLEGAFDDPGKCRQFRGERRESRQTLRGYGSLPAQVADVENFQDQDLGPLETLYGKSGIWL